MDPKSKPLVNVKHCQRSVGSLASTSHDGLTGILLNVQSFHTKHSTNQKQQSYSWSLMQYSTNSWYRTRVFLNFGSLRPSICSLWQRDITPVVAYTQPSARRTPLWTFYFLAKVNEHYIRIQGGTAFITFITSLL